MADWSFIQQNRAQVSIEFILLAGGVILAAVTFYAVQGSIKSFANVTADWIENERNASITKLTR
jgi:uncharacterized protein (UPF0333 family)